MTRRQRRALLALFTAGAAWAAFAPVLGNGFVNWDDPGNIMRNVWLGRFDLPALRWAWTTPHFGHFQPLAWLSLSLDHLFWGLEPAGYHLTALALHAAAAAALFALLRAFLRTAEPGQADDAWQDVCAAAAAVVWAVHPLRTEAVAWATERRELLAALFVFLSSRSYLLAVERDRDAPALGASLAWFGAACLSKVTVTPLPFAFLALDRWVLGRPFKAREKSLWVFSKASG